MRPGLLGARVTRIEDERPLTGRARYVADLRLPGLLEVAFVRSQLAHAQIVAVELSAARSLPGVIDAVAAGDLSGVSPIPDYSSIARPVATFPLCRDRVRYVGAPIAAIVAEDRYIAEDATELVDMELDPLPVVSTIDGALADDAPRLFADWPDNVVHRSRGRAGTADAAFAGHRTVGVSCTMPRQGAVPIETRGVVARYEDGRLTVWTSTQLPHIVRSLLATVLRIPERDVHVIAPDVGGAFGAKAEAYQEEFVAAWLAIRLGRPVRWIEDRYENLMTMCHSRDVRIDLEAAVTEDGAIRALRGTVWQDVGSGEMFPYGYTTGLVAVACMAGSYRIPHQDVGLVSVVTNKTPSGAYRGFGAPEAVFAVERLIDRIARELGLDRFELRRRMLLEPGDLPYVTPTGARIDSGSHRAAFERALAIGRRERDRAARLHAGDAATRIGLGIACYVEGVAASYFPTTGHWTHQETCALSFDHDGSVTAAVGLSAYGQGTRTMVATLVSELLGVELRDVRVVIGDTDLCPYGLGAWASRGTVVAAGALSRAAEPLRDKGLEIAAHLLEASRDDLEIVDGRFRVRGSPGSTVSWRDVAQVALARTLDLPEGVAPGLDAIATYEAPHVQSVPDPDGRMNGAATWTNATHAAVVKVDLGTGVVTLLRYAVVHDCGRVLNPLIVAGQVHGGVAQGIGGALYEEFRYDEQGQPHSATFMEYLLPTAVEIPPIELAEMESPAPETVFGVKGVGESGIVGPPAAIAGAVQDALGDGAPEVATLPLTPRTVADLIAHRDEHLDGAGTAAVPR